MTSPRFVQGPTAPSFLRTARKTGRRPSEIAGIGCEWCAWCFDEALNERELAAQVAAIRSQEREQEQAAEETGGRVVTDLEAQMERMQLGF